MSNRLSGLQRVGQLQLDGHTAQQAVGDECHLRTCRQDDVLVDRYIYRKRAVRRKIIGDVVHLSDLIASDEYRRLLLQAVDMIETAVIGVGGREYIHTLEKIESEEKKEKTDGGKYADLDFACVFHVVTINELAINELAINELAINELTN